SQVLSVAFSPNGRHVASGTPHYSFIQLWDAAPAGADEPARAAAWFEHHAGQRHWEKAAAALARVDRQLPEDATRGRVAGDVCANGGQWEAAAEAYERARRRDEARNAWTYHNRIGECRGRQGRRDEAIGHYTEAIRAGSPEATPWRNRGDSLAEQGKWREAAADFAQANRRRPREPAPWYYQGTALLAAHDLDG